MRVIFAAITAAAPLLLLYADPPFAHAGLYAGAIVCLIALACGYELAFVTYAIASWIVAAGFLVSNQRLDSPLSGQFADAAYLMTAAAVAAALARAALPKRRP
ncbi:MAG TPA: hypothetical protein VKB39_07725 [Candidatus Baltobacteraceae bacterium]|nr:hypothetical protein [Candidatus Baltobacteraceae bacterium]